ncbi:hypothetical protein RN001_010339 [Aquatica leii]|uniref:Glycosyltransferase family 92 protein n=1 Tax=Aquatica leii TaxID=1421715 RepID=A0AAN7QHE2_9COLE|nr:hypothetical protein RN001_010339 [Aquatica leii]
MVFKIIHKQAVTKIDVVGQEELYYFWKKCEICGRSLDKILLTWPSIHRTISKIPFYKVLVDKFNDISVDYQRKKIYEDLPSIPMKYWINNMNKNLRYNKTCAKFPSPLDVQYQNLYWQNLRTSQGHYQVFGAYLDTRPGHNQGPTIRILAMVDQIVPVTPVYCQIWFEGRSKPVITKASEYMLAWRKEFRNYATGIYQPYLIPCQIPPSSHKLTVAAVSLVEHGCDNATNVLSVFYNKPVSDKRDVAVCVKGLDFLLEDLSLVLTEWFEMIRLLGADKIYMYTLQVHPNVSKVLKYYEEAGLIEVRPLTLPAGEPNAPYLQHQFLYNRVSFKRQAELVPYNDCFYKHMYEYKYITLLDVDEIIVPLIGDTWKDVVNYIEDNLDNQYDSYNFRVAIYMTDMFLTHKSFDDIPEYMHMINHINRAPIIERPGMYIKSFHNTETVLSLHNHYPITCMMRKRCKNHSMDPKVALLHHYKRRSIEKYTEFLKTSVADSTIWKYKSVLIDRVTGALKKMGFLVPV